MSRIVQRRSERLFVTVQQQRLLLCLLQVKAAAVVHMKSRTALQRVLCSETRSLRMHREAAENHSAYSSAAVWKGQRETLLAASPLRQHPPLSRCLRLPGMSLPAWKHRMLRFAILQMFKARLFRCCL